MSSVDRRQVAGPVAGFLAHAPAGRVSSILRCAALLAIFAASACSSRAAEEHASDAALPPADADTATDAAADAAADGAADAAADAATDAGDAGTPEDAAPRALSETGLYADLATRTLAPNVEPYTVRWELWADGAEKNRYLFLPPGTTIDTRDADAWRFPIGTKAWKEFVVAGRVIETRLLEKHDAGWTLVSFLWTAGGSDAFEQPAGAANALGTRHDVPSSEDCERCHRGAADTLIGVAALQLDPVTLDAWAAAGRFSTPPPPERDPPGDDLAREVLGYVNANCGHCHNDRHPLAQEEALRLALPLGIQRPEDTPLYRTSICVPSLHEIETATTVVVPGRPEASQLYVRMQLRGDVQMPPLATKEPDGDGLARVGEWIRALPPCP